MLVKLVLLVFLQTALAKLIQKPSYNVDNYYAMGHHFEEFIKTYNRQYTGELKRIKFHVFIENVREINELNEKFNDTTFGINNFTDMAEEEMRSYLGLASPTDNDNPNGDCTVVNARTTEDSPPTWDWRDQQAVSPVKDQIKCGSCWAFGATALVESKYLQKGQPVVLSEQQLVDCDSTSNGCSGGLAAWALSSIMKDGGQMSESDYPYENSDKSGCRFDQNKVVAKVVSCSVYDLESGEITLQDLLYKEGPLAIALHASKSWYKYHEGIYRDCDSGRLNHAVLLVGYGIENGEGYWIIKNSWGAGWGEEGFIKLKKGVGCASITAGNQPYTTVSATVA